MTISEREEQLFAKWRSAIPDLVTDGAVDEVWYTSSVPRVVFLLKEVNDPGGGRWDLCEYVRKGARSQSWDTIARWVRGIRHLNQDLPWDVISRMDCDQRQIELQSIVVVNLKKSPGSHTTDNKEFWAAVKENAENLIEQISFYDADLMICCGSIVADAYDAFLSREAQSIWQQTRHGVRYMERVPGKFVLSYVHPEVRAPGNLVYYGLVEAVRELQVETC